MEEVTLLLYLQEEPYGKRLLQFLLNKKNPWIHLELVTDKEYFEHYIKKEKERLVILTDDQMVQEDGKKEVILLTNEQDREKKKIFQYQKAEGIYQELLADLGFMAVRKREHTEMKKAGGTYSVFSPSGKGTTCISVYLSQYLAAQGTCLYLTLGGFPMYYDGELRAIPNYDRDGLSELLFSLTATDFSEREKSMRQSFGKAYMLPPPRHFKDILDMTPKEWEQLIKRLKNDCGYDSVVVEFGQLLEHTLDYLELSDVILLLEQRGILGRIERDEYERYCQMENKIGLKSAKRIVLPIELSEWENQFVHQGIAELADNRQAMNKVAGWLNQRESDSHSGLETGGGKHTG